MVFSCQSDASDETQIDLEDQTRNPSLVAGCAVDGNDIDLIQSGSELPDFLIRIDKTNTGLFLQN